MDAVRSPRAFAVALRMPPDLIKRIADEPERFYYPPRTLYRGAGRQTRRLDVPHKILMIVQRRIYEFLDGSLEFPDYLHGGIRGRSTKKLAKNHRRPSIVMTLDLAHYFPSISRPLVEGFFRSQLGASRQVARLISRLTTKQEAGGSFLPQGSPSSSIIANLVFSAPDRRVRETANRLSVRYDRFVDDLVFSGVRTREIPRHIMGLIRGSGFGISRQKTKIMSKGKPQVVLGLNVDRKITPKHAFRVACQELIAEGRSTTNVQRLNQIISTLRGKAVYSGGVDGQFSRWLWIRIRLLEIRFQIATLQRD